MKAKFVIKGFKPQIELRPESEQERIMLTDLLTTNRSEMTRKITLLNIERDENKNVAKCIFGAKTPLTFTADESVEDAFTKTLSKLGFVYIGKVNIHGEDYREFVCFRHTVKLIGLAGNGTYLIYKLPSVPSHAEELTTWIAEERATYLGKAHSVEDLEKYL